MVDKKSNKSVPKKRKGGARLPLSMKKKDTFMMEEEAIEKARDTLDVMEKFFDDWEKAEHRPNENEQVLRIRRFYLILKRWYNDAMKAHKRRQTNASRVSRLREFILLCQVYS